MGSQSKAHRNSRSEMIWGYIMVAPTIIGLLVLNIYPFIDTFKLSFSKTLALRSLRASGRGKLY